MASVVVLFCVVDTKIQDVDVVTATGELAVPT